MPERKWGIQVVALGDRRNRGRQRVSSPWRRLDSSSARTTLSAGATDLVTQQRITDMAQAPQKDNNAELEAVKADLAQLRGDVGDLLKAFKEQNEARVRDRAGQARDEVKAAFDEGMETLNRGYQQARQHGEKRVEEAEQLVGNHPLTSVVAAFGVGFVIAKLLDGGRR
ncbi:DUF883 family protein [Guyparkeria halophila]|uniref:DUF883 family protein n=2 Tax=Thioalkalibacteraceae TaxID=2035710 RepID=A0A6I6D2M6_9GAMM|nr:DUF883 family protein [Guyparkeria halophila]